MFANIESLNLFEKNGEKLFFYLFFSSFFYNNLHHPGRLSNTENDNNDNNVNNDDNEYLCSSFLGLILGRKSLREEEVVLSWAEAVRTFSHTQTDLQLSSAALQNQKS